MIDLNRLKATRSQLLLAEVAGLLHDFGKVSSKFVRRYAGDRVSSFEYDLEQVVPPVLALSLKEQGAEISNRPPFDLAKHMLVSHDWGSKKGLAMQLDQQLGVMMRSGTPPSRAIKVRDWILQAAAALRQTEAAKPVVYAIYGACALAELLQEDRSATHYAYQECDQKDRDGAQQGFLLRTLLAVNEETYSIGELILLMWDHFHIRDTGRTSDDQRRQDALSTWLGKETSLPRYLITAHGAISGTEKDQQKEQRQDRESGKQSEAERTYVASAFGFEPDERRLLLSALDDNRDLWLKAVLAHSRSFLIGANDQTRDRSRSALLEASNSVLSYALGETKRPLNDITLWDYVAPIAALFKAAVAKAILEGHFVETSALRWQLLSVRYDGLAYLGQAHHMSDLLARKEALAAGLEAVRVLIEVEYPLGNEIYRDENGSVYVVPYLEEDGRQVDLLSLPVEGNNNLGGLIAQRFGSALPPRFGGVDGDFDRSPLDGEVLPVIALHKKLPEEPLAGLLGKEIRLPRAEAWADPPLQADPAAVQRWWANAARQGEVCTVCGLRPQGYGAADADWQRHVRQNHRPGQDPIRCEVCKAQDRAVCHICLERRDDRSKQWATDSAAFQGTIWTDEVADENGRLALIVGRFGLEGWLDGQLIATMQKADSFGRIRRCWRTTQEFWQEIEQELPVLVGGTRHDRLTITPENSSELRGLLGPYHAYELELDGRYLSVVWDPVGEGRLITAENLDYAQKVLAVGDLTEYLKNKSLGLYEPSAHLARRERKATVGVETVVELLSDAYSPMITLLAEPAVFMAMVPANKALTVAQHIRQKYELEMGKVRDRLPVHLGLVFAPRRTPIRALLEAGHNMLNMPDRWQVWQIKAVTPEPWDPKNLPSNGIKVITFENNVSWQIPVVMGDLKTDEAGKTTGTPDDWYTYFLTREPKREPIPEAPGITRPEDLSITKPWNHIRDVQAGQAIHIRPSLFDFEYLDATGRRFEISYGGAGRRRGSATRPLLLEDLERFERLWRALVKGTRPLSTSQLQNLEEMLLGRITEWHGGAVAQAVADEAYKSFARDVLHRLDKSWWNTLGAAQKTELETAVERGEILDLLDLMMHILKEPKPTSARGEEGATQ